MSIDDVIRTIFISSVFYLKLDIGAGKLVAMVDGVMALASKRRDLEMGDGYVGNRY